MRIGVCGLGKLGLPLTLGIEAKGHEVWGWDESPTVRKYIEDRKIPYKEAGAQELLNNTRLKLVTTTNIAAWADIVFVVVQTPHQPQYEGVTRLPTTRADFDYSYLRAAITTLNAAAGNKPVVSIVSTVLPGTLRREILPIAGNLRVCYSPSFIAMGTAIDDFYNPEFWLIGGSNSEEVEKLFLSINPKPPVVKTSIDNAELIKVGYNVAIGLKIVLANTLMEICHKSPGCNVDEVSNALALATKRIISPKYMRGGMGDSGACHPRDGIALSWLADELKLSSDLFGGIMKVREHQTDWLAELIQNEVACTGLPVVILGEAYKPESNLTVGSCSKLLQTLLTERGIGFWVHDPVTGRSDLGPDTPQIHNVPMLYFVATKHTCFTELKFAQGSVVLDPFRYITPQQGVRVVPIGIGS